LLVVAIMAGFLLVVSGGTAVFLYDRATAIDRSTPETVVSQFLDSSLVLKDPAKTSLFVCRNWAADDAIAQAKPPTDPKVVVTWGDFDVQRTGSKSTVRATVQFRLPVGQGFARDVQRWRLELEDQDGWRVCSLVKEGSINP
jgi:hypothetical protein